MYIDNDDNKMTFFGNIVYLRLSSVICVPRGARAANDTKRAQINNIPEKSHAISLLKYLSFTLLTHIDTIQCKPSAQ